MGTSISGKASGVFEYPSRSEAYWEMLPQSCYCKLSIRIHRNDILSTCFSDVSVNNFNVTGRKNAECFTASTCLNNLSYVDNMVLSAASVGVLHRLFNRWQASAAEHIIFNTDNTVCMVITPGRSKVRHTC